jgi:hypothetical protein
VKIWEFQINKGKIINFGEVDGIDVSRMIAQIIKDSKGVTIR